MNILVNIGVKNYDDDENNDKSEDIKNGLLDDFNNLIFFGFSENPFKAPNLSFDRRFKTVFWFRPTVYSRAQLVLQGDQFRNKILSPFPCLLACTTK